jgi:hypothetical protein
VEACAPARIEKPANSRIVCGAKPNAREVAALAASLTLGSQSMIRVVRHLSDAAVRTAAVGRRTAPGFRRVGRVAPKTAWE